MPWFAILYLLVALTVSAAAVLEDWREDPWWFSAGTVVSFLCLASLVVAYYEPGVRGVLGWPGVLGTLVFAAVWDTYELIRDTRQPA